MADRYADADPDESVSVGGQTMTLRKAVKRHVEMQERARAGLATTPVLVFRDAGKVPSKFDAEDLGRLADAERFR